LEELDHLLGATRQAAPKPVTLEVASPSHEQVHVTGLAWFFPASTVTAVKCQTVVEGDDCILRSVDHYHVRQLSMPLESLLEPGSRAYAELCALAKDPSDSGVRRFQRAMRQLAEPPEQHDTRATLPVKQLPRMVVTGSKIVQQGDKCDLAMKTRYVVERSEIQAIELFAENPSLVRSFVAAATELEPSVATRRFLRQAARATGSISDIALLRHGIGLPEHDTLVQALFGIDTVSHASVVMVGTGNEMDTAMQVHRGDLARRTVLDELGSIREVFAREAQQQHHELAPQSPTARQGSNRSSYSVTRRSSTDGYRRILRVTRSDQAVDE
jgi:hypothetical protein